MNHPVHFVTEDGKMSPSAFIPFCGFGGNMTGMGVMIEQFDIPVCNSFQANIFNDQLCYEVDLNRFSDKTNIDQDLKLGFWFLLDYNEDRQVTKDKDEESEAFIDKILQSDNYNHHALIYLNTIGKYQFDK